MEDEGFLPLPADRPGVLRRGRRRGAGVPGGVRRGASEPAVSASMGGMATHLITGAGSGIGAAVAPPAARARRRPRPPRPRRRPRARSSSSAYPGARTLVGDLADPDRLSWAFSQAGASPTASTPCCTSPGSSTSDPVGDLRPKTWHQQLNVNLIAPAELTRLLLPTLRASQGHVRLRELRRRPQRPRRLERVRRLQARAEGPRRLAARRGAARNGVRVTSVYPGRTASPMQAKVHSQEGKEYDPADWIDPESVATTIVMAVDLPRDAEVNDLTRQAGPMSAAARHRRRLAARRRRPRGREDRHRVLRGLPVPARAARPRAPAPT